MFTAKVYKIMVGSLSGAMEEVYVAKETIRKWNQQNAERTGKVFMPIEWGISREAIQNTDIVVGIIDNWIANPKCVEDWVSAGKQVMLLFNSLPDSMNTVPGELDDVLAFRSRVQTQCICVCYNGLIELNALLNERLQAF